MLISAATWQKLRSTTACKNIEEESLACASGRGLSTFVRKENLLAMVDCFG